MAFRGNQNRNRNFAGNYGGGSMGGGSNRMGNLNISPWDSQNVGNYGGGGNMRQGGGSGGQGMNAQAINLANSLLNNLFRNQNPPSLLDLPRGGSGMSGNRNQRSGQMINRGGGSNRLNNRRIQGGFQNRGSSGVKSNQKQGAGGIRKQNAFDRAKKILAKNATNKKKDFPPGEKKPESKESPYASVPNDMFYCHLCKKHMWDANSFENHIKGRTHQMMREGIEESYRLKANMIRQEAKIAEQFKSIELDRLKRMGKTKQRQLEYCTMCDLHFHGHISAHRKSEGHLQLKKFLHPKCVECNKEFATRIDYDSHLLSADHLKKAAEKNTKVGERKRNTLIIIGEEDELKDVRQPQKRKKRVVTTIKKEDGTTEDINVEVKQEKDDDGNVITSTAAENAAKDGDTNKDSNAGGEDETKDGDELNETQEEEDVIPPVDPEDCILDYNEGDEIPTDVDNRLPKYNWTRPVGKSLINKIECYECSICGKFIDSEKTLDIHARTVTHHRNFMKFINEKSSDTKIAQKRAAAAQEENERKKRKLEEAETTKNGEGAGNEGGDAEGEGNVENGEEEDAGDNTGNDDNGDLYDPSEATGDDEDVEMNLLGGEDDEEDDGDYEGMGDDLQEIDEEAANVVETPQKKPTQQTQANKQVQQQQQQQQQQQANANTTVTVKIEPKSPLKTGTPNVAVNTPTNTTNQNATSTPTANQVQSDNTAANNTNSGDTNSAAKKTPARGGTAKATRARGRGRYSRY